MLVDKGDSHEDAAPIGFFVADAIPLGSRQQVAHVPMSVLIVLQDSERVPSRSAISSKYGFTFRTYSQPKRAASGNELFAFGQDDPSTGKNRAGRPALRGPYTRRSVEGLRR